MSDPNPTDLDAVHRAAEESEEVAKRRRGQEIADFRKLMEDAAGRRFVWRLMKEGGVFHSSYRGDALAMAFAEGQRQQGLALLNEVLAVCPEHWLNMVKEQNTQ